MFYGLAVIVVIINVMIIQRKFLKVLYRIPLASENFYKVISKKPSKNMCDMTVI